MGCRETLDQAVEQGLRFRIDPVQILENQQQRLYLAFTQQQAFEGIESALASLWGIKLQEWAVLRQGFQNDNSAGIVSWRVASSVTTCPVTLARMVRGSSRSAMVQ